MTIQSDILNANLDWLQEGKEEVFAEYKIADHKTIHDRIETARRSTFDRSKFTVVGSPSISDDGILRTDYNNYLKLPMPSIGENDSWEMEFLFKTGEDIISFNYRTCLLNYLTPAFTDNGANKTWGVYSQNDTTNPHLDVLFDTTTWQGSLGFFTQHGYKANSHFKIVFGQDNIKRYATLYNLDLGTSSYKEVLLSTLTSNVKTYFDSSKLLSVGKSINTNGSTNNIDLKGFVIRKNGVEVFNGNKTGIDQIKEDNYTKSHNDVVVTNGIFDIVATNAGWKYVSVPINLKKEDNWEFWGSFTTPDVIDTSLTANALGTGVASNDILSFGCNYRYDLVTPRVYNDNDTFSAISDIGATNGQVHLPSPFTPNTKYIYYFKNNISGLEFGIKKETDTEFKIGVGPALTGTMRTGYNSVGEVTKEKMKAIDLNDYKQFVNGSLVYQATLQIPYTLSKTGSKIVDAVYRDRVQDMYEQFGYTNYYTIGDVPEKYNVQVVGNPTLENGVASGFSSTPSGDNKYLIKNLDFTNANSVKISFNNCYIKNEATNTNKCLFELQPQEASNFGVRLYKSGSVNGYFGLVYPSDTGGAVLNDNITKLGNAENINGYVEIRNNKIYININGNSISYDLTNAQLIHIFKQFTLSIGATTHSYSNQYIRTGTIDLSQFSIEVDGKEVYRGYEPSIPNAYTLATNELITKQDVIQDLDTIRTNASSAKSTVDTHVANATIHVTANDKVAWSQKQNTSDNTLTTTDKTIVGAINELNAKPSGGTTVTFIDWRVD